MATCEENWRECCKWLTRVGLLSPDHRTNLPQATIKELAYTLRDGVQLCRLTNLICPGSLDLKEISQKPQMAQFLCLRNIRTFLGVCKTVYELKDQELFLPEMLFDLTDFRRVLFTLSRLSNSPKAVATGIEGFSDNGYGTENALVFDDEMCQNLEELASNDPEEIFEEDYYSIVEAVQQAAEEDIYQDLCYIDRQPRQPPVTLREKRDYVKGELLETESNYIDALNMVKKHFMKPLANVLKEDDRKIIFFGVKELSDIHTSFLSDLNRALTSSSTSSTSSISSSCVNPYGNHSKTLGDVFCHWKDKFVIYGDYCANLTRAQGMVEELCQKNELIAGEVAKCEKDVKDGRFKLRDVLSVPMQRVLKYHLLLQKLLDETSREQHGYEEYKSIEKARDAMTDVAEFTNEVKRDSETLMIIRQIEGSIYDLKMPDGMELKDYGRLQRDGELRIRGHDDNRLKSRYVFIFDKVMLMCKPTRSEQYSYKHSLCLQEYRVEDVPQGTRKSGIRAEARWTFCWNLVHHKEKNVYTMYAQTEEQKKRWIKAIEDALTNIQPEECRRTDHHWSMHTFPKGITCSHCSKFLKGVFYQGYRCVRCDAGVHRDCISLLPKCGLVHPPELPPRPPLLPIHPHNTNQPAATLPLSASTPTIPLDPIIATTPTSITVSGGAGQTSNFLLEHSASFSSSSGLRSPRRLKIPTSPSSPPLPLNNLNSPCTSNGMIRSNSCSTSQQSHHYVNLNHLESYPWYGGELDRDTATRVLMDNGQLNGTFLVRVRPQAQQQQQVNGAQDAIYALSLRWNDGVKHMKILVTRDEQLFYLSESRYFKSVVELINWYQHNSLAESFSGLDARLERPFVRLDYGQGIVHFDYNQRSPSITSLTSAVTTATQPAATPPPIQRAVPGTPS